MARILDVVKIGQQTAFMTLPAADLRYHHGRLRLALIDAALAEITTTGSRDLSLRKVARQAGVSHNAPYAHFADKRALLAAVAARGFERLAAALMHASAGATDGRAELRATGLAYIGFGSAHAAEYRLMFGPALSEGSEANPELAAAAGAARNKLATVIARGVADGSLCGSLTDVAACNVAALAAWSLVHGHVLLAIDGLTGCPADRNPAPAVIDAVIAGLG